MTPCKHLFKQLTTQSVRSSFQGLVSAQLIVLWGAMKHTMPHDGPALGQYLEVLVYSSNTWRVAILMALAQLFTYETLCDQCMWVDSHKFRLPDS